MVVVRPDDDILVGEPLAATSPTMFTPPGNGCLNAWSPGAGCIEADREGLELLDDVVRRDKPGVPLSRPWKASLASVFTSWTSRVVPAVSLRGARDAETHVRTDPAVSRTNAVYETRRAPDDHARIMQRHGVPCTSAASRSPGPRPPSGQWSAAWSSSWNWACERRAGDVEVDGVGEHLDEAFGLLAVREVPGAFEDLEPAPGDRSCASSPCCTGMMWSLSPHTMSVGTSAAR